MHILSLALGGCIKGPPVAFGLTEDTGGHITYLLGAARALADTPGVERVTIVTRLIDDPVLGPDYARETEQIDPRLAIRRIDSGDRRYLSKETSGADRAGFTRALIAWVRGLSPRPACIHAHFADAAEVAAAVEAALGIPFIYTPHSLGHDKARLASSRGAAMAERLAMEDRAIARASAIVASSRDECERQIMAYPSARAEKVHCIPPGASIDDGVHASPDRARALIAPFLRDGEKPLILAVARPVAKKNLVGLVRMFGTCPGLRDTANLAIVAGLRDAPDDGEPEQRSVIAGLLAEIDRHDLYGQVALPKRHDRADILSLFALARASGGLFANPAFVEPYGLTLTEAAAFGVPVVATDRGGPPDIVARLGHGVVVDPIDEARFAEAMLMLLRDPLRWQKASQSGEVRAQRLSWAAYARQFVQLLGALQPVPQARPAADALLLCDIDGTLTGCSLAAGRFSRHVEGAPSLAFGVATGRSLQEALRVLGEWGLPEPDVLAPSVGSEIYWRRGGRLVADDGYAAYIAEGWSARAVDRVLRDIDGYTPQRAVEQRAFKRSGTYCDPALPDRVRAALADADLHARVIASHGHMIDILPARAGKAAAMEWIAEALGVDRDRVFAAGDSGNDLDMLDACANAILVGNHCDRMGDRVAAHVLRARATHADGVIEGLARLGLAGTGQAIAA